MITIVSCLVTLFAREKRAPVASGIELWCYVYVCAYMNTGCLKVTRNIWLTKSKTFRSTDSKRFPLKSSWTYRAKNVYASGYD